MNQNKKRNDRKKAAAFKIIVASVMTMFALTACSFNSNTKEETTAKSADGKEEALTDLVIPVSEISSTATYYPVEVEGTAMEVVAVKAPDGSIRTAFNTCEVCYDSGRGYYVQEGDVLVCQNCGNRFPMNRVEVEAGGCNPWPIFDQNKTVTEDSITISSDFLKESKQIFANWKRSY